MFIKKIEIKNFRIFSNNKSFEIDNINATSGVRGSGLTVFVGENGCGKTTILDAIALPILEYKADSFSIKDLNDVQEKSEVKIFSQEKFSVDGTMPKGNFDAKGFSFEARTRSQGNKSYLSSSIVSDQKFISCDPNKPKENSPDLRVAVNNPFKGKRFSENDIIFLDKNRLFQTKTGNFNGTRFDRLMSDLNHQYLKSLEVDITNLNQEFFDKKIKEKKVENGFLVDAIQKFKEFSGVGVRLDFLDNCEPFKNAFFSVKKDNNQQLLLSGLGSGYEMIFSIIYSFFLSKQSGKQLIILIDEPELHMHPNLQERFIELLLEFSKDAQIIITSHSPLLVKQLSFNDLVKVLIVKKEGISLLEERVLPFVSANETNYLAFGLPTEEYHNELYNEIEASFWNDENNDFKTLRDEGGYDKKDCRQIVFDNEFFSKKQKEPIDRNFKNIKNKVTVHTFIRNQIHHQRENGKTDICNLKSSIEKMRNFINQF